MQSSAPHTPCAISCFMVSAMLGSVMFARLPGRLGVVVRCLDSSRRKFKECCTKGKALDDHRPLNKDFDPGHRVLYDRQRDAHYKHCFVERSSILPPARLNRRHTKASCRCREMFGATRRSHALSVRILGRSHGRILRGDWLGSFLKILHPTTCSRMC